jgi:AraC-like DNA-binding protein
MTFFTFLNEAHFNAYDMIILMIVLQSFIFSVLLLVRTDRHVSHWALAAFIGSIGFGQFVFFLLYQHLVAAALRNLLNELGFALLTSIFYIQGVLLHLYLRTLIHGQLKVYRQDFIPLAVAVLVAVVTSVVWDIESFRQIAIFFWKPFVLTSVIGFAVSLYYGVNSLLFISRYWEQLKNRFSTLEHMDIRWLFIFTSGFTTIWFFQILPPFFYERTAWWLQQLVTHSTGFLSLFMINFVFFKGLLNARRVKLIRVEDENVDTESVTAKVTNEALDLSELKQKVDEKIRADQLYSRSHLNIERMSQLLDLPVRQFSFLINHGFNQNYFEFINHYRLEAAKERLKSKEWMNASVQEIYESVGFSSRSTFFTLFKKLEGITPAEYRSKYSVQTPVD